MLRAMRRLGSSLLLAAALASWPAAAQAQDPTHWRGVAMSRIPIPYYQGIASDPDGDYFFDGVFVGLHRTDGRLRQRASVDNVIPAAVTAREGYNHIGDITWDEREGGRILLPLECYYPGTQSDANTCHTGSIGVADPRTLRWRYSVKLSPQEIPKAMWAEVSPDGRLLWTSAGNDLLAYRVADIRSGARTLRAVRRLRGAVPPTGITGAAFYGERLILAGQRDIDFEVWSVDLNTGRRRLEIRRGAVGESEGLDVSEGLEGVLHWIITPFDPLGRPPTYGQGANALLHFMPRGTRPKLRLTVEAIPAGRRTTLRFTASTGGDPVAGAVVRVGDDWARTDARGIARLTLTTRSGLITATGSRPDLRAAKVSVRVR
jgi:hypothetical protein